MGREDQPRDGVRGLQEALEAVEDDRQAACAAAQPERALVAVLGGRLAHLCVHVADEPPAAVAVRCHEGLQGRVQAAAVEVGVQVAQAGRQAPPHLAVGGGMLATHQLAGAVAQTE